MKNSIEVKSFLNVITIPTLIIDKDGKIISYNDAFSSFLNDTGLKLDNCCSTNTCPFKCKKPLSENCILKRALDLGKSITQDVFFKNAFYRITGTPIFDKEGKFLYFSESIFEITDLIREKEILQLALKSGSIFPWKYVVKTNTFHNLEKDSVVATITSFKDALKGVHPDDVSIVKDALNKLIKKQASSYSYQFRVKDLKNLNDESWHNIVSNITSITD